MHPCIKPKSVSFKKPLSLVKLYFFICIYTYFLLFFLSIVDTQYYIGFICITYFYILIARNKMIQKYIYFKVISSHSPDALVFKFFFIF